MINFVDSFYYFQTHISNQYLIKKYDLNFKNKKIPYQLTYDYYYYIIPNFIKILEDNNLHFKSTVGTHILNSKHFEIKKTKKIKYNKNKFLIIHIIEGESKIIFSNKKSNNILSHFGYFNVKQVNSLNVSEGDVLIFPKELNVYMEDMENDSIVLTHELDFILNEGYSK